MNHFKLGDMKLGWFCGNFKPTAFKTKAFEVAYKVHRRNEAWPMHYHKKGTEINLLVRGEMAMLPKGQELMDGTKILRAWDIFIVEPKECLKPHFFTDCEVVCIKAPSIPKDKVVVK